MVACEYVQSLRAGIVRWVVLLTPVLALTGGCASAPLKPPEPVALLDTWNNNVQFLPDPCNGGRRTPALIGHLYLMDTQGNVITPDDPGTVMIQVYEEHPRIGPDGNPMALEAWRITPECLKQYVSKDVIGKGYNIAVPWNTYRPDIGRVEFMVSYTSKDPKTTTLPLFHQGELMTFQNSGNGATGMTMANGNQMRPQMPSSGYSQGPIQQTSGYQTASMQISPGPQPGSVQVTTSGPPGSWPPNNHVVPPLPPNVGPAPSMLPANNVGSQGVQPVSNFSPPQPLPSVVTMPQSSPPVPEQIPQPPTNPGDQATQHRTSWGMPSSPGMAQPAPLPSVVVMPHSSQPVPEQIPQPPANPGDQATQHRTSWGMPSSPGMEQPAPVPPYTAPQPVQGTYNLNGER